MDQTILGFKEVMVEMAAKCVRTKVEESRVGLLG